MTMTGRNTEKDITIKSSDVGLIIDYTNRINENLRGIAAISGAMVLIEELCASDLSQREQDIMKREYHIDHLTEAVGHLTNEAFGELFEMEEIIDAAIERAEKQVEA
jgi:hypothetical protein